MKTVTLRRGMLLYHGTDAKEDFEMPRGPAWFSNSIDVARWFSTWHDEARPRILVFKLKEKLVLPEVTQDRSNEIWEIIEDQGIDADVLYNNICSKHDGWIIPDNYPQGADIMICSPDNHLMFVGVTK